MKKSILLLLVVCLLSLVLTACVFQKASNENEEQIIIDESNTNEEVINNEVEEIEDNNEAKSISGNDLSDFDLSFLKIENNEKNMIYSPLSIKYALKMLEEGAEGEAKEQINRVLGSYNPTKYASNSNMSLANGLFVRNTFKEQVKQSYIDLLKNNYEAEVVFDSFENAETINNWISDKTFKIIPKMLEDSDAESLDFALINALAIDMEWEEKFLPAFTCGLGDSYAHENMSWRFAEFVSSAKFENMDKEISGMEIETVINNYDIIKDLGEENIRKTVSDEYRKYLKNLEKDSWEVENYLNNDTSDENIEKEVQRYLEEYMTSISANYGRLDTFHHYSIADNSGEKVFVKDLKEYDGTTLQYVGIMPKNDTLKDYINNQTAESINNTISTAKELKNENFKDGVITEIFGHIPKFKFEYDLDLLNDLTSQGINDVFENGKAKLTNITDNEEAYITDAKHKANIEFTQEGIKAAAATILGGAGAGDWFDYIYDVPIEKIDMTFDKPYMFLIRDKQNGEIWFVGMVYEPLLWEEDNTKADWDI